MQQNEYFFNIADFNIQLKSDKAFQLEVGYEPFVTEKTDHPDFEINCIGYLPYDILEGLELVFEASNEQLKLYLIYKRGDELIFVIYSQQNKNTIQQIAILDKTYKKWTVYVSSESDYNPLLYPMGPIIMHYMTINTNSAMMHASCIFDGEKGRMFSGFSGVGKSTISNIWREAGSLLVNDDRLIIRKIDNQFYAYNTPMYYYDKPKKTILNAIYLIRHSPQNTIKKIDGAMAASRTMAYCIQNNYEKNFVMQRINFFISLVEKIHVYELGFVPDSSVIDFIKAHE